MKKTMKRSVSRVTGGKPKKSEPKPVPKMTRMTLMSKPEKVRVAPKDSPAFKKKKHLKQKKF